VEGEEDGEEVKEKRREGAVKVKEAVAQQQELPAAEAGEKREEEEGGGVVDGEGEGGEHAGDEKVKRTGCTQQRQ